MSATFERHAAATEADDSSCFQCGTPLDDDQEWCLECGSARTLLHTPPDWRIGVVIVGSVIALVLAALAIVLINLSSDANNSAQSAGPAATQAAAPAGTTASTNGSAAAPAGTASADIATWPIGLPGWTVVLATAHTRAAAQTIARRFSAGGTGVGVLNSSEHPSMTPGLWVVFSGRYATQSTAQAAAAALFAGGDKGARARLVGRPGA
jgi:SPOR domain